MTQDEKELLLKDISARLSYGVKCAEIYPYPDSDKFENVWDIIKIGKYVEDGVHISNCKATYGYCSRIQNIKPYLFPISSLTEEQKNECFNGTPLEIDKYGDVAVKDDFFGNSLYTDLEIYLEVIDWLLKNHFDIYGLIEKGLAIDCTNLKIY